MRNDTCAMAAISLNLQQKVHPVIWQVSNLPFDATRIVPIKKPLGGTLILCFNSLIYLNQSVPPYGVSLNSIAESSSSFPLSKWNIYFPLCSLCVLTKRIHCFRTSGWHKNQSRLRPSGIFGGRSARTVAKRRRTLRSNFTGRQHALCSQFSFRQGRIQCPDNLRTYYFIIS